MKFLLPLSLLISGAAFAQSGQNPPPSQQQENQQQSGESMTVVGCLMKGSAENQFTITDSKTGQKYNFAASQQLESYLNHTVQLTGTMSNRGGEQNFQPQSIRTVSNSCQNPQQQ
jgi:hypothetical protein